MYRGRVISWRTLVVLLVAIMCGAVPGPDRAEASTGTAEINAAEISSAEISAATCPEVTDSVVRLYSAYFLREPDDFGLQYWIDRYRTGKRNIRQISEAFAVSPEFVERYGTVGHTEFVVLVYGNVLDREPDQAGATYWANRLQNGLSRGAMMIGFSESAEYIEKTGTVQSIAGVGRIYPVGTTFTCGTGTTIGTLYTGNRDVTIDVLGVNTSGRAQNLLVWADHDDPTSTQLVVNEILSANEYLLLWQSELAASPSGVVERSIRLDEADDRIWWVAVAYPAGMALDRPGWQSGRPLQLR